VTPFTYFPYDCKTRLFAIDIGADPSYVPSLAKGLPAIRELYQASQDITIREREPKRGENYGKFL